MDAASCEAGNRGCDRLSNLPIEVLHHILCLLPLKEFVGMSVLSTRWKYTCASVPTLCLDEEEFSKNHEAQSSPTLLIEGRPIHSTDVLRPIFINLVDRAFAVRANEASLDALTLSCDIREDASQIKDWIAASVSSNVKDLSLSFNWSMDSFEYPEYIFTQEKMAKELHTLPDCLFKSQSLVALGIRMRSPYYILRLPSSTGFSRLKDLNLSCIMLLDDDATHRLFASPLLERLSLSVCSSSVDMQQVFSINAPKIQILSIRDSLLHQELRIDGTCLKYFYYEGELGNRCCISGSALDLVKAEINVPYHYGSWYKRDSVARNGCELLNSLSMVKKLTLYDTFIEYLQHKEDLFEALPVFNHLTTLVFLGVDAGLDCSVLFTILRRCPRLGTLKFCGGLKEFQKGVWEELLEPVPLCFQTHLKKMVIQFFECSPEEVFILLILLRASMVLEEVAIYSSTVEDEEEPMKLVKRFQNGSYLRITCSPGIVNFIKRNDMRSDTEGPSNSDCEDV